jgi:hypothetical protein
MLKQWLDSYNPKTIEDSRNALREMMQDGVRFRVIGCGLSGLVG